MKKYFAIILITASFIKPVSAQFDLNDLNKIINIDDIVGKALNVKKGYAPKFSLGGLDVSKISKVTQIFNAKGNGKALKLFNTFKTGRTIYRVAEIAGTAIAIYGVVKKMDKASIEKDYKAPLIAGLTSMGTGLLTKLLTKAAAYKATDAFNGIITDKIKDILSVKPASSTLGVGLYVKL